VILEMGMSQCPQPTLHLWQLMTVKLASILLVKQPEDACRAGYGVDLLPSVKVRCTPDGSSLKPSNQVYTYVAKSNWNHEIWTMVPKTGGVLLVYQYLLTELLLQIIHLHHLHCHPN